MSNACVVQARTRFGESVNPYVHEWAHSTYDDGYLPKTIAIEQEILFDATVFSKNFRNPIMRRPSVPCPFFKLNENRIIYMNILIIW
jgi:hypothetical protein